jgi:hypothetical protein
MTSAKWLLAALFAALFAGGAFAFGGGRIDSLASLDKIRPGVTTVQQVREMFGPPARSMRFPNRGIEAIEYEARDYTDRYIISISYGSDGIVREVLKLRQATP